MVLMCLLITICESATFTLASVELIKNLLKLKSVKLLLNIVFLIIVLHTKSAEHFALNISNF